MQIGMSTFDIDKDTWRWEKYINTSIDPLCLITSASENRMGIHGDRYCVVLPSAIKQIAEDSGVSQFDFDCALNASCVMVESLRDLTIRSPRKIIIGASNESVKDLTFESPRVILNCKTLEGCTVKCDVIEIELGKTNYENSNINYEMIRVKKADKFPLGMILHGGLQPQDIREFINIVECAWKVEGDMTKIGLSQKKPEFIRATDEFRQENWEVHVWVPRETIQNIVKYLKLKEVAPITLEGGNKTVVLEFDK